MGDTSDERHCISNLNRKVILPLGVPGRRRVKARRSESTSLWPQKIFNKPFYFLISTTATMASLWSSATSSAKVVSDI